MLPCRCYLVAFFTCFIAALFFYRVLRAAGEWVQGRYVRHDPNSFPFHEKIFENLGGERHLARSTLKFVSGKANESSHMGDASLSVIIFKPRSLITGMSSCAMYHCFRIFKSTLFLGVAFYINKCFAPQITKFSFLSECNFSAAYCYRYGTTGSHADCLRLLKTAYGELAYISSVSMKSKTASIEVSEKYAVTSCKQSS